MPPCPWTPRVYSNSCPLSRWCHPTISSSVIPFSSCLQCFPGSQTAQLKLGWACQTALKRGCEAKCSVSPICFFVVVQCSVMSDSLRSHGPQHAKPPCPSPTPGVHSNSCPLSWWCHPTISSPVVPFSSCLQSLPASGSFPMSQLFASGGQSIGATASILPMNIQGFFFNLSDYIIMFLFKDMFHVLFIYWAAIFNVFHHLK